MEEGKVGVSPAIRSMGTEGEVEENKTLLYKDVRGISLLGTECVELSHSNPESEPRLVRLIVSKVALILSNSNRNKGRLESRKKPRPVKKMADTMDMIFCETS